MPDVSVLMTVYNGIPYVQEAVDSIIGQTFEDWVLIIVNDGSTDDSAAYLDSLDDPRIRVIHQENGGTAVASNNGLKHCNTEFLARMDSDDICDPTRFEKQMAFLRAHPKVSLVGTQIIPLGSQKSGRPIQMATDPKKIYSHLRNGQHAMCHPTIMMRTKVLKQIGGYWKQNGMFDAWDMFLRMGEVGELANLAEPLLYYRIHTSSINGRQMRDLRGSIDFACELARCREQDLPQPSYDEYFQDRAQSGLFWRLRQKVGVYALLQYRMALIDMLGGHPMRGYGRLGWSALCSPSRTLNRLVRSVTPA